MRDDIFNFITTVLSIFVGIGISNAFNLVNTGVKTNDIYNVVTFWLCFMAFVYFILLFGFKRPEYLRSLFSKLKKKK